MAYVYSCDCGYVARDETADEFVADIEAHIDRAHPDMIGKLSREDILALAEEQYARFWLPAPRFRQTDDKEPGSSSPHGLSTRRGRDIRCPQLPRASMR